MKRLCFFFCVLLAGCKATPEPIQFGTDGCHLCKMTLVDRKFGGELVTNKGKVYKFDDLNCMLNFYHSGYIDTAAYAHRLVVAFNVPGVLIDAPGAFFLKSDRVRSPMGGGIAAFSDQTSLKRVQAEMGGIDLRWQQVLTQSSIE